MKQKTIRITNEKDVLKATQSVWAVNKYFVLASSQQDYLKTRELLRKDKRDLNAAYFVLKGIEDTYCNIPSEALPQISNALYHMAGYFKKLLPSEKRQELDALIKKYPDKALAEIEKHALSYRIEYLIKTRLWLDQRKRKFNGVPISIKHIGHVYRPYELLWMGDYLISAS